MDKLLKEAVGKYGEKNWRAGECMSRVSINIELSLEHTHLPVLVHVRSLTQWL